MRKPVCLALVLATLASAAPAVARPRRAVRHGSTRMTATAYCQHGRTRSGMKAQGGVAAADLRRFPLGTRLHVLGPGMPYHGNYTVLDSGSAIRGRDLDIFMPSCRATRQFGKRPVQVRVVTIRRNRGYR